MVEGWFDDDYLMLFDGAEAEEATRGYGVTHVIPGARVIGLKNWDELILDDGGGAFSVPAVPLNPAARRGCPLPPHASLQPDTRFGGLILWHIKPVAFGGDAEDEGNMTWVSHTRHRELVVWWNTLHTSVATLPPQCWPPA